MRTFSSLPNITSQTFVTRFYALGPRTLPLQGMYQIFVESALHTGKIIWTALDNILYNWNWNWKSLREGIGFEQWLGIYVNLVSINFSTSSIQRSSTVRAGCTHFSSVRYTYSLKTYACNTRPVTIYCRRLVLLLNDGHRHPWSVIE